MPCPVRALNVADNVVVGYNYYFFNSLEKAVLSGLIKWEDAFEMWSSHYTPSTEDSKPIGEVLDWLNVQTSMLDQSLKREIS